MYDRLRRLVGAGSLAALAMAALAVAQENSTEPARPARTKPTYSQRAYRITIDQDDEDAPPLIQRVGYDQPVPRPVAPPAPTRSAPMQPVPVMSMPPATSTPSTIIVGEAYEHQGCGECSNCKCGKPCKLLAKFRASKNCGCADCQGCKDCGCGKTTKAPKSVVVREVVVATDNAECSECDSCTRCKKKLFGHSVCGTCGKHNLVSHHEKCDSCQGGPDCAEKEPHHFSSGANKKKCCNPDGSICDNVCNDKGCNREPCPCPSNEVLSYYRCGHYGHYPTFWRSWPTGWLTYRPPMGDTMYDRFKKPQKGTGGSDQDNAGDKDAPESDPDLLNKMRARQNRTNNLGEQMPENMQPRRRPTPERVPDADLPEKLPAGKTAPKPIKDAGGSYRSVRPQTSNGVSTTTTGRGTIQRVAYVIEQDDE